MKIHRMLFASIMTLLVACLVHAADSKPIARVTSVTDIQTDDASSYAQWFDKANKIVKAKLGIDTYYHVYTTGWDGTKTGSVRVVIVADSASALVKNNAALANDPGLMEIRVHTRALGKAGARVLNQAVRFDGTYKGSYVSTTLATVTDEAGYLKAMDGLRALLDSNGLKDIKINAYRVLAGRTNYTHRVAIAAPSNERLAAFIDFTATSAAAAEWIASAAKFRTVVSNNTAHDIVK